MSTALTHIETEKQLVPALRFKDYEGQFEKTKLGEVSTVRTGPFGSMLHQEDYVDEGTPIITVEHLSEQGIVHENLPLVSDSDKLRLKSYILSVDDIVFSRVGSVDRNSIISEKENGWLFSGRLLRIRTEKEIIESRYLGYYFQLEFTKHRIRSVAVGQTMASLNTQILKSFSIEFPSSITEQQKIATFLSAVDEKIQQLTKKKALLEQYKKGVMQQLFSGQLRFKDENGNPYPDWEEKRFTEVKNLVHGDGDWILSENLGKNEKYSIIQLGNIGLGEFIDKKLKTLSEENFSAVKGTLINKGDILINRMVDNDLNVCLFPYSGDYITSVDVCWIRSGEEIDNSFISFLIQTRENQKKLLSLSSGSGRVRISKKNLFERFKFQLPTLGEQQKIATYLSSIDTKIEAVTHQITQTQTLKKGLLQQLFV